MCIRDRPLADNARKHACQMLVDAVSDKAKDNTPAFCTGDFNATPDAPEIATTICQSGILKDAYREAAVQHGALFTSVSYTHLIVAGDNHKRVRFCPKGDNES